MNEIVVGYLNINSIRNKFDSFAHQIKENIDILMISKANRDESFPPGQCLLHDCSVPFRFDRKSNGKIYHPNFYLCFFVEINLRIKKKWLLSCPYNPTFCKMSKSTDLYLTKYDQLLFLGDVNTGVKDSSVKNFCSSYNYKYD